jgi:hypothetical protein
LGVGLENLAKIFNHIFIMQHPGFDIIIRPPLGERALPKKKRFHSTQNRNPN